jgi:hypothetical protein
MRGVAGIFVQTQAADPDQFEAIGRLITNVNRCWRSEEGLLVVPDSPQVRVAR